MHSPETYQLENDGYTATVTDTGAELISLKAPDGEQYMWSGDAAYWTGRAPILFPIVGRMKDGGYRFDGRQYKIPKHGLVRRRQWVLTAQTGDSVTLSTKADKDTLVQYPFDYELSARFQLQGANFSVSYTVSNHGDSEMLFSLGSHPAFALPLAAGEGLDQWLVEFSENETLDRQILDGGLIGHNPVRNFLDNSRNIPLSDSLFNDDSLIFFGVRSQRLDIVHATSGRRLSVHTGGAPDIGIWAKPCAPYVCLEPWYGYDDPVDASGDFRDKPGLLSLAAGEQFETAIRIELTGNA